MNTVSFSQYSIWKTCPQQYKLKYIDKESQFSGNIYTLYGTAMHETVQHYLDVMYNQTKKKANDLDLEALLQERLIENFKLENEKFPDGEYICTKDELEEFFLDGKLLLRWFKKNIGRLFIKQGRELVGIEVPLEVQIRPNLTFKGYIDIIIKENIDNTYVIIDLKTATKSWGSWKKKDKTKDVQLMLYKKYYSELFNVPMDNIVVEFHVLKRKINEDAEFPIPRASRFSPAQGKTSINKAVKEFDNFVDTVFDGEGNQRTDVDYPKVPGDKQRNCKWCEFYERGLCDGIPD